MKILKGVFFGTGIISSIFLYTYIDNYMCINIYEGVVTPISLGVMIEPACWAFFIIISFVLFFNQDV